MRRHLLAALAAALLLPGAASAGQQDFRLVNRTGHQIDAVHVSKSQHASWEEDVLGEDVLPSGRSVNIRFSNRERGCMFDLLVMYHDGDQADWRNINLCEVSVVTLSIDGRGRTRAATE